MRPTRQHFLEAFDSVRLSPPTRRETLLGTAPRPQACLDSLISLAMGRQLVVPQSYAFDSWTFLNVAGLLLEQRPQRSNDKPFRLHLYGGTTSYEDAVASMVRRTNHADRPFISSLLPDLAGLDADRIESLTNFDNLLAYTPDAIAKPLAWVAREFADVEPLPSAVAPGGPSLDELVEHFLRTPVPAALDDETKDIAERLHRSLRLLRRSMQTFTYRSRLRSDDSLPDDPDGRSPADIVGGDDLALVIEFIDGLYNRVVAGSIPMLRSATYCATPSSTQNGTAAYALARFIGSQIDQDVSDVETTDDSPPMFELRLVPSDSHTDQAAATLSEFDGRMAAAFGAVLEERQDERSKFCRSVDAIDEAADRDDPTALRRALDKHLVLVARIIEPAVRVDTLDDQTVTFMTEFVDITAATSSVFAASMTSRLSLLAGVGVMRGARPLVQRMSARRQQKQIRTALHDIVSFD